MLYYRTGSMGKMFKSELLGLFCLLVIYGCARGEESVDAAIHSSVTDIICECRSGEWRRGDAFLQKAYTPVHIQPSLRLEEGMQPNDMLAGSGKLVSFNRDDWTTAVSRGHDIYIILQDRSELRDVIFRRIRLNVQWARRVLLQVLKVGHFGRRWTTISEKAIIEDDVVTEVDFRFKPSDRARCDNNCYGLEGWSIRILLEPVDVWHVAEIEGLIFDLCQSKAAYDAMPKLECLQTPDGKDYVGDLNRSASGKPCALWSSSVLYTALKSRFPDGLYGAANRCRNPTYGTRGGPFCLTDLNGKLEEETCDLPTCNIPKVYNQEFICTVGEIKSFYWANNDGVQVASSVTLRSANGDPVIETKIFSSLGTVLMADELEWSELTKASFDLIFEFEPVTVMTSFTISTESIVNLTLHHSMDGRQWTPSYTVDIPNETQKTMERSTWGFRVPACLYKCSGVRVKYIRLIIVGVGTDEVPKLAGADIVVCRPIDDLEPVCQFGPSRSLDMSYAKHILFNSNIEMRDNIDHILYEMNETLYARAEASSFNAVKEKERPYIEFFLRSSQVFTVKKVTIKSWYVKRLKLLGSMDGRKWSVIEDNRVFQNLRGSPAHSVFWPHTYFRLDGGDCPHSCSGLRVKYLRLAIDGGHHRRAPWFRGLKVEACFDQNAILPTAECKTTLNGISYSGHENRSTTGTPCLPWKDSRFWRNSDFPDGHVIEASNYCRHPDTYYKHSRGPWCFTAFGDQYCDIPTC